MLVVDLNVLLYAVNADSPHHKACLAWLEAALSGDETVALPWVVLLGFVRLATHPRVLAAPLDVDRALEVVDGWLACPVVTPLGPGAAHWRTLRMRLAEAGAGGNLVTDAHLAALALDHEATLVSTDADFARFRGLRRLNPTH